MEDKSRFTVLIDADVKREFEDLCAEQDVTASQMIRRLMRDYVQRHATTEPARAPKRRADD